MKRTHFRLAALTLALIMALALTPTTAEAAYTAYSTPQKVTTTATINFRSGPGTKYSRIGAIAKDTTVERIGTNGTWSYVKYNGQEGWISSKYVKETGSAASSNSSSIKGAKKGTATATARANVRSGPGTGYGKLGKVKKGTAYDYYEVASNGWVRINFNGKEGWVSGSYMNAGGSNSSSNAGSSSGSSNSGTKYVQATAGVNVRSGPGTKYSIIGGLYRGDVAVKLGTSGNWVKIQTGNQQTGYVSKGYVKDVAASSVTTTNTYNEYRIYIPNDSGSTGNTGSSGSSGSSGNSNSSGSTSTSVSKSSITLKTSMANEVANLVNAERRKAGLPELKVTSELTAIAQERAKELVSDYSHNSAGNLRYGLGENIAMGQRSAAQFVNDWMNSSGHRENILRTNYDSMGVGIAEYNGVLYGVNVFKNSSSMLNSGEWKLQTDPSTWGTWGEPLTEEEVKELFPNIQILY